MDIHEELTPPVFLFQLSGFEKIQKNNLESKVKIPDPSIGDSSQPASLQRVWMHEKNLLKITNG